MGVLAIDPRVQERASTPHVSGSTSVHMRKAVDVFVQNVRSLEATRELVTGADPERGY